MLPIREFAPVFFYLKRNKSSASHGRFHVVLLFKTKVTNTKVMQVI